MTDQERLSMLALHFIPGVGTHLVKQLISYCGSAEEVFKRPKGKLIKIPGVGNITAEAVRSGNTFIVAEKEMRKAEKHETEILFFTDKRYPARLRSIDDAPSLLYFKGNCNLNNPRIVGIVGTRQATAYGKNAVEKIVEALIPFKVIILSGLAYGIDIYAHKQALKHHLPTVAVMGSGMDVIYPYGHQETALKMTTDGGLLTENHFGTKPDAHNFPSRNRIIAGLCDALIVAEAAHKGGALITADIANSYNKDVFAVPGGLDDPYSSGCNQLIKTHKANLFTSVKDLEYIMNWTPGQDTIKDAAPILHPDLLTPQERLVIQAIQDKSASMQIDELAWKTSIPHGELASLLLGLEFRNLVQVMPGKMYRLLNIRG